MTSVPETKTQVLIVGAGPAGLVMALCLAKCGVKSVIIERQPEINPHPKAHELNTRSLEILASLGISLDELSAEASPKSDGCRIAFCTTINNEFGAIDLLRDIEDPEKYDRYLESDVPYLNISQTEVERVIRRHVITNPHIDLRLSHEWQSVETEASRTRSSIKQRSNDRMYEIEADWLIAADGAGSRVRQACGIEMIGEWELTSSATIVCIIRSWSENPIIPTHFRSEEHTSELQSPVPISYAVFCLKKKKNKKKTRQQKKKKYSKRHHHE